MKYLVLFLSFTLLFIIAANAQMNVGSNTAPLSSAMLQVSGNTRGFLPPRMSRDSMYLIASPATGLLVYNTTDSLIFLRRDTGWIALAGTANDWSVSGNKKTNSSINFIGTTDNHTLSFKTNNLWRMHLDSAGGLFIGDSLSSFSNNISNTQAGLRSDWATSLTSADTPRIALQGQIRATLTPTSATAQIRGFNGSAIVGVNDGVSSNSDIYGGYFISRRQSGSGVTDGNGTLSILAGAGIGYGHTSTAGTSATTTNVYGLRLDPSYAKGTITNMYGLSVSAPQATGGTVINMYDIYLAAQSLTGVTNSWGIYQANTKNNYFAGNVGIGTASPATALHIVGTNPLTLSGVQAGTSTTADSLLTITNGLVRKLPLSTFATPSNVLSSLNGLTATTQTFATGTSGTNFTISSSGAVHTFNIPDASATARGLITTGTQTIAGVKTFSSPPVFSTFTVGSVPYGGTSGLMSQNNAAFFWDAANNRLGVGTNTPATTLSVTGTNPLTLNGVQAGTNTSADSLLTITSGLVKKLPLSTFITSGNAWSITGNSGTNYATNFLGTTDNISLRFRTNNIQRLLVDSLGNVAIGSTAAFTASPNAERLLIDAGSTAANPTTSFNLINARGYIDNYLQLNIQNKSPGASASSDVVATADNGDESSGFIDLGINSSGFTGTGAIGGAGTAYLYSTGNDLAIGNGSANKSVVFFTGGLTASTYTERFRLDANGRVGIGTSTPASDLAVFQSAGTGSTRGITFAGNSISGTNTGTGFLMSLGYNSTGNKQLWLGDPDYANNATGTFLRFEGGGTTLPTLDAIAGDNSVRRYLALGVGGDANSGVTFGNDNSTINPGSYVWDNGNMAIGNGYRANTAPTNGLLVQGNVGIGTTSPSTKLHIVGTNPLTLIGVQAGTNTSADSLLTITSGLVRKLPLSTFATSSNVISSLNGLTAATQTFAVGTSGTTPAWSSSTSTHTLNIPLAAASSVTAGLLSNADWTTFNNKATTTGTWSTTGNANINTTTNYLGTLDANDVVFKANAIERMRIVAGSSTETGTTGDIKIGDATSGTFRSTKEFVMREDGDAFGPSVLRLRNRNGENGAIFETIGASAYLVDFIYRTGTTASPITSNIRFETRAANMKVTGNTTEWQIGQPDVTNGGPTLVVGASGTGSVSSLRIGNFGIGVSAPTAVLHLKAGTATANTAPLKLTSGTSLTTPEDGAVEYDGTNYYATQGTTRYTLAKTLTATATLNFASTAGNSSSTTTVTVTGATDGDVVMLGVPNAANNASSNFTAYVSAANTVTVKFNNYSSFSIDPASATFRVSVIRY